MALISIGQVNRGKIMTRRVILLSAAAIVLVFVSLGVYLILFPKRAAKEVRVTPVPPSAEQLQPEILPEKLMVEDESESLSVLLTTLMEKEGIYCTNEGMKKESDDFLSYPWAVQVFASHSYNRARDLRNQLEKKGFPVYQTKTTVEGQRWHRVRIGFYRTKEEANKIGKIAVSRSRAEGYWTVLPCDKEVMENLSLPCRDKG